MLRIAKLQWSLPQFSGINIFEKLPRIVPIVSLLFLRPSYKLINEEGGLENTRRTIRLKEPSPDFWSFENAKVPTTLMEGLSSGNKPM
jgi:hypothetical protein